MLVMGMKLLAAQWKEQRGTAARETQLQAFMHAHECIHVYIHACAHVNMHIHTCTHAQAHTHTHTHT